MREGEIKKSNGRQETKGQRKDRRRRRTGQQNGIEKQRRQDKRREERKTYSYTAKLALCPHELLNEYYKNNKVKMKDIFHIKVT